MPFDTQILLWGYAVGGPKTWEFAANVSENHPNTVANTTRRTSMPWDGNAEMAASLVVHPPRPTERYVLAGLPGLLLLQQGIEP